MTMRYNSVMYKVNNGTRLFIRFLREKGIKYIYIEETLRNEYRKYEEKKYSHFLNDMNGNLLKYFDSFFSLGVYKVTCISFIWASTKNGYDFWEKMEREWELYRTHK